MFLRNVFKLRQTAAAAHRAGLSPEQRAVLLHRRTEPPYSSLLLIENRPGTYQCAGCGLPLFEASTKYISGTGWPSFYRPIAGNVRTRRDYSLLVPRTEYHCARCGGHQGHVFRSAQTPSGQRWCNNGRALEFVPAEPQGR